jgi:hypothetical protein
LHARQKEKPGREAGFDRKVATDIRDGSAAG